ncbi:saccharopine dehydrogenase family protein [Desulfolutivibrio sulfoxidireducens]|uniref:saccharopine dehydrogenase family protein n=2 Tax=Desulfolutivibrio sulfoxidireducens TaxID=2773299 RepID=UPI00159D0DAA|nr:saccharopine dehydrogenase NADP-binding domain-containing protein [Desulfolutivibrio sulfoxidireducens]
MMKGKNVLLLGAGAMGALAARTVSAFDEVASLTVASLNRSDAEKVAVRCPGLARAESVDVTDHDALVGFMRQADLVLNCVGPFFRFGPPILQAAIEAGVDYLDICDDPEPTRIMLDQDAVARDAGVTAIIGMGASPGINNLLGACVHDRLDTTDLLVAGWNIEEKTDDALEFSAAVIHWMEQCSGTILECRDGSLVPGRPLLDLSIDYPGRGRRTIYTVGHPEPVSFHSSWPDVRETHCGMVMPSAWIGGFRKYRDAIDAGKMTLEQAGRDLVAEAAKSDWIDVLLTALSRLTDGPRLPLFFVLGTGRGDGREKTVAASLRATPPDMASMTGVPLALGALLHLRGQTAGAGVMAPERAFDPDAFFELFAPYCTLPRPCPARELVELVEA